MTDREPKKLTPVEAVRKRPAMYVGSTDLFGFIHYLVAPIALVLAHRPTRVAVAVGDALCLTTDAALALVKTDNGIAPFEEVHRGNAGHALEGIILNGLSSCLTVITTCDGRRQKLCFEQGVLKQHTDSDREEPEGTTLTFQPDTTILRVVGASRALVESYFHRLSFLHSPVSFSYTEAGRTSEYHNPDGLRDLFVSVSSSYQIMHEPIHIRAEKDGLSLELVMAYHSWSDDHLWCFINNGRAVEGGTHEEGLRDALNRIRGRFQSSDRFTNGVVAVASLHYAGVVFEGCIKARIGNPELVTMVSELVVDAVMGWLGAHPDAAASIEHCETFPFPEIWL